MTSIDWPNPLPPAWLHDVYVNADGSTGPALFPLDPRIQLYAGGRSLITSAFQAAHALAYGGVLTPGHYAAEARARLAAGDRLGGYSDAVAAAFDRGQRDYAVRLYLASRHLDGPLMTAAKLLKESAAAGRLLVHGRRVIAGMTTPLLSQHEAIPPHAFIGADEINLFGNTLGVGTMAISHLRFDLNAPVIAATIKVHVSRFDPPVSEARQTASWHFRAGEKIKAWVTRADVLEEARSRLHAGVTAREQIPGVLVEMAREMGATWSEGGIRNAYRTMNAA